MRHEYPRTSCIAELAPRHLCLPLPRLPVLQPLVHWPSRSLLQHHAVPLPHFHCRLPCQYLPCDSRSPKAFATFSPALLPLPASTEDLSPRGPPASSGLSASC